MLEIYFNIAIIVMMCTVLMLSRLKVSVVTLEKIKKGLLVVTGFVGGLALFIVDNAYSDNLRYPEFSNPLWFAALVFWGLLGFSFFCWYKQLKRNAHK